MFSQLKRAFSAFFSSEKPLESHAASSKRKIARFSVPRRRKNNTDRKKSREEENSASEDEISSAEKPRKKRWIHSPEPSDPCQRHKQPLSPTLATSHSSNPDHPLKHPKHEPNQGKDLRSRSERPQRACYKHRSSSPSSESMISEYTSEDDNQHLGESSNDDEVKEIGLSDLKGGWDGWPQGNFLMKLTWDEYKNETDKLAVEWAFRCRGVTWTPGRIGLMGVSAG
uniref:Uncharacterized protein n=1 Tax=Moniliophthora roreri TaxID=221103 RepID=A0A0W0F683_MONRR